MVAKDTGHARQEHAEGKEPAEGDVKLGFCSRKDAIAASGVVNQDPSARRVNS